MTPEIEHLGAKNCVTGSCHLVQTKVGVNILVDFCKLPKAYGNDHELAFNRFPVSPRDIDYLFLTHAHIDHIGRVPDLIDAIMLVNEENSCFSHFIGIKPHFLSPKSAL